VKRIKGRFKKEKNHTGGKKHTGICKSAALSKKKKGAKMGKKWGMEKFL